MVVIARDNFKVLHTARQMITNILNGGPPAQPRVVSPKEAVVVAKEATVGIYSHVRLAAAEMGELGPSDDLEFQWTVKRPDGTPLPAPGCDGAAPKNSEVCFDVTGAGVYAVDLTTSEAGQTRMGSMTIKVEDRPPCIRMTEPIFIDTTGATTVPSLDGEERVLKV